MSPDVGRSRLTRSTPTTVGTWWQPATRSVENRWVDALSIPASCCTALPMEHLSRSKTGAHTGPASPAASRGTTSSPDTRLCTTPKATRPCADAERIPAGVRAFPCMKTAFSCGPGWVNPRWPLRPPPVTPWLNDAGWATIGDEWETKADVLLLHENFADITHVAVVDPYAPPVLRSYHRRSRWRSPKPPSRFLERTSLPPSLHGKRSFSDCRPTPNTSSMNRAPS